MRLITFALALLLSTPSPQALAEAYPSKPVKLVIAFAAGSATDSAGRASDQGHGRNIANRAAST